MRFLTNVIAKKFSHGLPRGRFKYIITNNYNIGNFEIVLTYFYPKPYMTYGELGRIRGKYPKLNVVELYELLETLILSLCGLLCLCEVAKRNRGC